MMDEKIKSARNAPRRALQWIRYRLAKVPTDLDAELRELVQLSGLPQHDPQVQPKRLTLLESVLGRLQPGENPSFRAALLSDLGAVYAGIRSLDQVANLQRAIACFREALDLYSPDASPLERSRVWINLGAAYSKLPIGNPGENQRQTISCYQEALRAVGLKADPLNYAGIHSNLGLAWANLPDGDRRANLQQAIIHYREALTVYTLEGTTSQYAGCQGNLATAYASLPTGDLAENLHRAISCYEKALGVLTPETYPLDYADLQHGMGVVYLRLPTGDRLTNIQKAVECFDHALRSRTPDRDPLGYAMTLTCLGNAFAALPTRDPTINLQEAVTCYQEALRFYTPKANPLDYALVQNNLGTVLLDLPAGDRENNLQQAIACFREALQYRTPDVAPLDFARTENNLGVAYGQLPDGNRTANLKQAKACYSRALTVFTPETAPADCRRTACNLGDLYFSENHWEEAHIAYDTAIDASEALYLSAATERSRQSQLAEVVNRVLVDGYCLARLGRYVEAIERLEAGRTRSLAEALDRERAALELAIPEDRTAFEAVRNHIKALEGEARATTETGSEHLTSEHFAKLSSDLSVARQELAVVVERIRTYVPEFMPAGLDFEAIAATLSVYPLVYLITTSQGSLALIVPPRAKELNAEHAVWLNSFNNDDLDDLLLQEDANGEVVGGYLVGQVEGNVRVLRTALDRVLPILKERLIGPLAARLSKLGVHQATLVPGGRLALLPLHAAFGTMTVTYAPSVRTLEAAKSSANERVGLSPILLGIGNPLPNPKPLIFARAEVEAIVPFFAPEARRVLYERQATSADTLKHLLGATHVHFSCHGAFDVDEPLDSALFLSGEDTLTLRDLLDGGLDVSAARLAVLSACQTGIIDFRNVPDEAVGFPAGFIQAGVPGVISTLWPVDAVSTAVLLRQFYQYHLEEELEPAIALRKAQLWLRDATVAEMKLAEYYEQLYQASGRRDRDALKMMRYYRTKLEEKLFEHPYYWAGFVFSGV